MKKEYKLPKAFAENINYKLYHSDVIINFLSNILFNPNGCWLWERAKNSEGYGYLWNKTSCERVHRISYKLFKEDIPINKVVMHNCDNPSCCNPEHLIIGTRGENNTDRALKNRNRDQDGENNNIAKLTWVKVRRIRKSNLSRSQLAKIYCVSRQCIDKIINNKSWIEENVEFYE